MTGDCAVKSSETGYYKILGRFSQDIIKKSGYKISALEIEGRLLQNDMVREVAVVGTPNEEYGEEIVAFVVKNDEKVSSAVAEKELKAYIREHMSTYKIPRVWKFIDALPKNQMGKVSKKDLKKGLLE